MRAHALAVAALLASACGPSLPRAPLLPQQDPAFKPETVPEPPGMAEDSGGAFKLMPGDVVDLRTLAKTPLEAPNLLVDQGGGVHVPLVGRVIVQGLSLRDAELAIEKEITQIDRFAKVGLSLRSANGHQAVVIGAVGKPGLVNIAPGLRLVDLLAAGGGPKTASHDGEELDLADIDAGRLIRNKAALPVSVRRAVQGDARHNVRIEPGDVLMIPPARSGRISVFGKVKLAKTLPFRSGMRLSEAIASAGGTEKGADEADIRIIRGPLSKPLVYFANMKDLVGGGEGRDVVLAPGDIVYVTTSAWASFAEVLSDLAPIIAAAGVAAIFYTAVR